jgi:predicted ATPase
MAILSQPVPDVQRAAAAQARSEVPDALADLVYRMLEKDRAARIPSVRLVGAELEAISQSRKLQVRPEIGKGWQVEGPRQRPSIAESRFATPTPTATEAPRHDLPVQPTPFVGREAELVELDRLLKDPDTRLVTILGVGGMGKTRLALEAAGRQVGRYPDGVYWVSLAPLLKAEAIVPAVAGALGFTFYAGAVAPRQQLLNYLHQKRALLLFDNYEHVLEGVDLVSDILRAAPETKVLATSRASLNIQEEHLYHIGGMEFPEPIPAESDETPKDALDYSAVKLFMQSARRARPGYELQADDLKYVSRICRLVQGMPLGILLAAAWIEILSPEEIAYELETREDLDFLSTDLRNVPERQRSMRAVFDHSWSLLTARERGVMEALSAFRGGFTRAAGQEVTGASLTTLRTLVNRSLLHRAPTGRYEVHELLRQYAAEKLDQSPDAGRAVRDAHSAYYATALAQWADDLKGVRQQTALAELNVEIENARAAWEWAFEHVPERAPAERMNKAMDGLALFYHSRARFAEGESAFRRAADRLAGPLPSDTVCPPDAVCLLRAQLLARQSWFCVLSGRNEQARESLRQSLDLLGASGSADTRRGRASALYVMGHIEVSGNIEKAWQSFRQALALHQALDQRWEMARTLGGLATVSKFQGDFDRAKELSQKAVTIFRELGDRIALVASLLSLASVLEFRGQFEECERLEREGLAMARDTGDQSLVCTGLLWLARTLICKGEFAESYLLLEECLRIGDDMGAKLFWAYGYAWSLQGMTMAHLGQYEEARVHLQQALALARKADILWAIGRGFLGLGLVALAEGNADRAWQYLQEGVAALQKVGDRTHLGSCLAVLAGAARRLGRPSEARGYLYAALQLSSAMREALTLQYALPMTALLLIDLGQAERAVEIYALASRYGSVADSRLWEVIAGRELAAVAAVLPPEVADAAKARGRARDLWATVEELLVELPDRQP